MTSGSNKKCVNKTSWSEIICLLEERYSKEEIFNMTLAEIKARIRYISKRNAEEKLNNFLLSAIAAQGDKKAIEKITGDIKKSIAELN